MSDDLDALRKTAEAATPGPWTLEYENSDDWEAGINDGDYPYTIHGPRNCSFDNWADKSMVQDSLNRVTEISEMVDADAEFIATFDPPTVLALLNRLEQAEQAVKRKQSALDTVARIVETQCEAVVLATDSQDLIGEDLDGDWDAVWGRLSELADSKRTAEQAVQRVREVAVEYRPSIPEEVLHEVMKDILEALDGDGRG